MLFIVEPRFGLCNQLQSIVKGILLSNKYNRNIYINGFQKNIFEVISVCDINEILDLDEINEFLNKSNITVKIVKNIDDDIREKIDILENVHYNEIPYLSAMSDIIEMNLDKPYLNIGNPVSLCAYQTFKYDWNDHNNLYWKLCSNIKFHKKFYTLKNSIKEQLKLQNYVSIHMRIEDDAIGHFAGCYQLTTDEYNNKLIKFYLDAINDNKEQFVYISSSMSYFLDSINSKFYNDLLKNNEKLCDKKNIEIDDYYLKNRELLAIVDLLIAYDGDKFFGSYVSSYSQFIANHFIIQEKPSTLFIP